MSTRTGTWGPGEPYCKQPYVYYTPAPRHSILSKLNNWSNKAESMANAVWQNLRTGSSVPGDAWGKVNLAARAASSGGGFDALFRQTFSTSPNETLKRSFACYLSTTTGPVAGTLYISTVHVAFCSDRPLSFREPSGLESWSYYKVVVPIARLATVNPAATRYVQLVTCDAHDFCFLGFVNFEKASRCLSDCVAPFAVPIILGIGARD